jgi:inhibitor of KinA sporulation pathway (predicted exonuclease)
MVDNELLDFFGLNEPNHTGKSGLLSTSSVPSELYEPSDPSPPSKPPNVLSESRSVHVGSDVGEKSNVDASPSPGRVAEGVTGFGGVVGKKRVREPTTWGSLKAPTSRDVIGPRKTRKALDAPLPLMTHLIVLDFEWTADNTRPMTPLPEITQFPSALVRLPFKRGDGAAVVVDTFNTYVRPVLNPVLTNFSIELTGITQDTVDTAPTIPEALPLYLAWLRGHGLIDAEGQRVGHWQVVTWGDVDVMTILRRELLHKGVDFPPFFNQWINLKADSMFKKHFGVSACMLACLSIPARDATCVLTIYKYSHPI